MIFQIKTLSKNPNWAPQLHSRETMGGAGRSRTQRKHFRQNRQNVWKRSKSDPDPSSLSSDKPQTTHWTPFETQNPSFDSYYKEQRIVDPQEWEQFVAILRTPLPASFRINSRFTVVQLFTFIATFFLIA